MPYFLLSYFVRGAANVSFFLLQFVVASFLSEANPTTMMSRRQGLPRPPSPTTHSVLLIVPRTPRCMPFLYCRILSCTLEDNDEEEARSPSSLLHPTHTVFLFAFSVCIVFLAAAQPILVFFLLRPNNYDEEGAASTAYVSILLSCR